ncbi:MAG: hypothetical protein P8Y97_08270 [Candidatus Lokiarchaeota archaeon]
MEDEDEYENEYWDDLEFLYLEDYNTMENSGKKRYRLKSMTVRRTILALLVGLIVFMVWLFPYYISQYSNTLGRLFEGILNQIGNYTLLAGVIVFGAGVFSLVFGKKVKLLLIGIVLILAGIILTGGSINLFGFEFGIAQGQQGYH